MASPTQWTWVWANTGRYRRTGKATMLQSMGSQSVRLDLETNNNSPPSIDQGANCWVYTFCPQQSLQPKWSKVLQYLGSLNSQNSRDRLRIEPSIKNKAGEKKKAKLGTSGGLQAILGKGMGYLRLGEGKQEEIPKIIWGPDAPLNLPQDKWTPLLGRGLEQMGGGSVSRP